MEFPAGRESLCYNDPSLRRWRSSGYPPSTILRILSSGYPLSIILRFSSGWKCHSSDTGDRCRTIPLHSWQYGSTDWSYDSVMPWQSPDNPDNPTNYLGITCDCEFISIRYNRNIKRLKNFIRKNTICFLSTFAPCFGYLSEYSEKYVQK